MCLISRLSANATGAQQGEQIVGSILAAICYEQPNFASMGLWLLASSSL